MTGTESRFAQIEKEALATTWACEKFSTYVLGMKFLIETDHKPLVPLLGTKHLDSVCPQELSDSVCVWQDLTIPSSMCQENSCTWQILFQELPPLQLRMSPDSRKKQKL